MLLEALVTQTITDVLGTAHNVVLDELPPLTLLRKA
jgi:hypothetical protein